MKQETSISERRSFLTRLKVGAAAAIALGGVARAQDKTASKFEPARHAQDDWFDQIPGKHRLVFDTTKVPGFTEAALYANNYLGVNRNNYGLENTDSAVVIVARHISTVAAFNDEMWARYGAQLVAMSDMEMRDGETPTANPFNAGFPSLDTLIDQGVHFAVCAMATRRVASGIAQAGGGDPDVLFEELTTHLVKNGHMVPAGIVAVSRAQERGYTLVSS